MRFREHFLLHQKAIKIGASDRHSELPFCIHRLVCQIDSFICGSCRSRPLHSFNRRRLLYLYYDRLIHSGISKSRALTRGSDVLIQGIITELIAITRHFWRRYHFMCPIAEAGRGAVGEKKADQRGEQ